MVGDESDGVVRAVLAVHASEQITALNVLADAPSAGLHQVIA